MGNNGDAKNILSVSINLGDSEGTIEKLLRKQSEPQLIRISCWDSGHTLSHPLVLTEKELAALLQKAIRAGVLSPNFMKSLQSEFEI